MMIDEELLQNLLSTTVERIGKQTINYETEIANLNAQIMLLNKQIEEMMSQKNNEKNSST
jgi:hypothetical protein